MYVSMPLVARHENNCSRKTTLQVDANVASTQGCQIFLGPKYQNGVKDTKLPQNIPNGHKIFPMVVK
jgi:hypothetical protein